MWPPWYPRISMEAHLYQEMFDQEQRHWWFRAKRRVVLSLLSRTLRVEPGQRAKVADLGCGCGATLAELQEHYDAIGVDGSELAVDFSRRRGVKVVQGLLPEGLQLPPGQFDAVLMLDVLEHLDDDSACARAAAGLLRPGGVFVVTVPAYQWLFSQHDHAHHHKRRYTASQVRSLLASAGLHVELCSYMNSTLFPLAVTARLADRCRPPKDAAARGLRIPPAPVNALFEWLFAAERHLLGRLPLPFGLSVIAIARK